jgi:glycerophosphoryl diester phosphodiesterase
MQALAGARETAPDLLRALLLDTLWPGCMDIAASLECVAIITNHELMDASVLAQIHDAGRRALVYTVNDPARADELIALGIDGIVTDAVDRLGPDEPKLRG